MTPVRMLAEAKVSREVTRRDFDQIPAAGATIVVSVEGSSGSRTQAVPRRPQLESNA